MLKMWLWLWLWSHQPNVSKLLLMNSDTFWGGVQTMQGHYRFFCSPSVLSPHQIQSTGRLLLYLSCISSHSKNIPVSMYSKTDPFPVPLVCSPTSVTHCHLTPLIFFCVNFQTGMSTHWYTCQIWSISSPTVF